MEAIFVHVVPVSSLKCTVIYETGFIGQREVVEISIAGKGLWNFFNRHWVRV